MACIGTSITYISKTYYSFYKTMSFTTMKQGRTLALVYMSNRLAASSTFSSPLCTLTILETLVLPSDRTSPPSGLQLCLQSDRSFAPSLFLGFRAQGPQERVSLSEHKDPELPPWLNQHRLGWASSSLSNSLSLTLSLLFLSLSPSQPLLGSNPIFSWLNQPLLG